LVYPGQQQPGLQQLATFIFKEMVSSKLYLAPCILETRNSNIIKQRIKKNKKKKNPFLDEDILIKIDLSMHSTVYFLSIVTKEQDNFILNKEMI